MHLCMFGFTTIEREENVQWASSRQSVSVFIHEMCVNNTPTCNGGCVKSVLGEWYIMRASSIRKTCNKLLWIHM